MWNSSLMAGPQPIPVYGTPTIDAATGQSIPNVTGYSGVAFVFPADHLPVGLERLAVDVPPGCSDLAGVACKALVYADEPTAKSPLAAYWTPDLP